MNDYALEMLEFNKVIDKVKEYALSEAAQNKLSSLKPSVNPEQIIIWLNETSEARAMLEINPSVPISSLENIIAVKNKLGKETLLNPLELKACQVLLETVKKVRRYMNSVQFIGPHLAGYADSMYELNELRQEIEHTITFDMVADRASAELATIRKKIAVAAERRKQKLADILKSSAYKEMLQEPVISERRGRYVVPIRRQFQKNFPGRLLDLSATGSTAFMEPYTVGKYQDEIALLKIAEEKEINKILSYLTNLVEMYEHEISINIETLCHYDFVFAKAKYSIAINARPVAINTNGYTILKGCRNPLLNENSVPLDLQIGREYRALVITGPNTGGKTVALKSVGLMTLMAQSGLHLPVAEGSEIAVYNNILVDIGDGQSIEQSLSTFSAHVRNIVNIIACAGTDTLVIMDELGSGTDPAEGHGFAIAILEEIFNKGATIIASTHFGEIKEFAKQTEGFENGCMEFDIETLSPQYKLKIGYWGESNAFLIALKLGIEGRIIERAHEISYGEKKEYKIIPKKSSNQNLNSVVKQTNENRRISAQLEQRKKYKQTQNQYQKKNLRVGDRVYISFMEKTGIVYAEEDAKGDVMVLVKDKKIKINCKRLSLHIPREELYPENYDFDILFESKENRKKRKKMQKHHVEGLTIEKDDNGDEK